MTQPKRECEICKCEPDHVAGGPFCEMNDKLKRTASERDEALAAIRKILALIDGGTLVRDTNGDADVLAFMRQGAQIVEALQGAQALLAKARGGGGG